MKKLSDRGRDLIIRFEGKRNEVYLDSANKKTIGIGHLVKPNEVFTGPLTDEQIFEIFRKDVEIFETAINNLVSVELNQNQFDSLVSLVFNIGTANFFSSTIRKHLNSKNFTLAANEFPKWNKVYKDGKYHEVLGLTRRRLAEQALFNEPFVQINDDYTGKWYSNNIKWALDNGILSDPKNTRPEDPATRAEVITMLKGLVQKFGINISEVNL